jgi:hypothetical protein
MRALFEDNHPHLRLTVVGVDGETALRSEHGGMRVLMNRSLSNFTLSAADTGANARPKTAAANANDVKHLCRHEDGTLFSTANSHD